MLIRGRRLLEGALIGRWALIRGFNVFRTNGCDLFVVRSAVSDFIRAHPSLLVISDTPASQPQAMDPVFFGTAFLLGVGLHRDFAWGNQILLGHDKHRCLGCLGKCEKSASGL